MVHSVLDSLKNNPLRKTLIHHPFFEAVRSGALNRKDVAVFLGQWWHPLHYFPDFLSRSISVVPNLETKTAICAILSEELGEGNPDKAGIEGKHHKRGVTLAASPLRAIACTLRLGRGSTQCAF